ncbi:MAG: SAM-dependent methyltransferase [Gammaproteobacteria bacterium]|nr:SAM-dependent methyltransferase [Gammaproteobacteria bacterium]
MSTKTDNQAGKCDGFSVDDAFSTAEWARSAALAGEIQRLSPARVTFADFMQLALLHPRYGYYASRENIFGRDGDFITAPDISPLYAGCLARSWQKLHDKLRSDDCPFEVLEVGPGSGRLAAQLLSELARLDALPSRYWLYEPSAMLAGVQKETLGTLTEELAGKTQISWLSDIATASVHGVIVANEVADALPVEIARRHHGRIEQLYVAWDASSAGLSEQWVEATPAVVAQVAALEGRLGQALADDYRIELHTDYRRWLGQLSQALQAGQIWVCDYGYDEPNYYHPQRGNGTVQCHRRHRRTSNPLEYVGLQDISTAVNFDRLYDDACTHTLALDLYQPYGRWLIESGAFDIAQAQLQQASTPAHRQRLRQQFMQLTGHEAMGELFKMAVFSRSI